ncbi:MAG: hypothetical protein QXS54_00480 [Candidatus Methanomethylicaceae archaeon]
MPKNNGNDFVLLRPSTKGESEYFAIKKLAMKGKVPLFYQGQLVDPDNFPWYLKGACDQLEIRVDHLRHARRLLQGKR